MLTRANLKAFMNRDWAGARTSKDKAIASRGTSGSLRLSQALIDQVWPRLLAEKPDNVNGLIEMRRIFDGAQAERLRHRRRRRAINR